MRKLILALALCAAATAQGIRYDHQVTTTIGQAGSNQTVIGIPNASTYVCAGVYAGTACTSATLTVYSDSAMTHVISQPLNSDAQGNITDNASSGGGFYYAGGPFYFTTTPPAGSPAGVGTTVVAGPGTTGQLNSTSPAITPTSIEGVEYADQFSGSDIGAKINAAFAVGTSVVIPPGTYTFSTPIVEPNAAGCSLTGAGAGLNSNYNTILKYTGTGSAIAQFTTNQNAGGCSNSGFVLDGSTDTNTNVSGINFGGSNNFSATNVTVQHFNQTGDAGIKPENKSGMFTERYVLSGTLYDNTTDLLFAVDSGGLVSFEHGYVHENFSSNNAAQTWISVTGGGSLSQSWLALNGNCGNTGIGGTALAVDGSSSITDNFLSFLGENDGTCTIFDVPTGGTISAITTAPFNSGGWTYSTGSGTIDIDGWIGGSFHGVVGNATPLYFQNSSAVNDAYIEEGVGGVLSITNGSGSPGIGLLDHSGAIDLSTADGVVVGSATGSYKGIGTINIANGLYVNGTALIGGAGGFSFAAGALLPSGQTLSGAGAFNFGSGTMTQPATYTVGSNTITNPSSAGTLALTSQLPLSGTVSITASATALAAVTGTATITGATTSMACVASAAGTADADAFPAHCWIGPNGTANVQVVTRVTDSSAPAITYNIRVIQ